MVVKGKSLNLTVMWNNTPTCPKKKRTFAPLRVNIIHIYKIAIC